MPSKKKNENTNIYDKIPKKFLLKTVNPNYDIHNISIPCYGIVCGASGAGKTAWLMELLLKFSANKGTMENIWIISRNSDEPLYNWLKSKSEQIIITEGLGSTPDLDKMDKSVNNLVIFDDLVLSKNQSLMESFFVRSRKMNCSVFYLSQGWFRVPKIIRSNANLIVLLKISGDREIKMILSEFGLGVTKEQMVKMYQDATSVKMRPLIVDISKPPEKRFRQGFLDYLDVNDYL